MAELNLSKAKSDGGHEIRWSRAGMCRRGETCQPYETEVCV